MTRIIDGVITIHLCECGRWEGTHPQAGCCPGCGRATEPTPYRVRVLGAVKKVRA